MSKPDIKTILEKRAGAKKARWIGNLARGGWDLANKAFDATKAGLQGKGSAVGDVFTNPKRIGQQALQSPLSAVEHAVDPLRVLGRRVVEGMRNSRTMTPMNWGKPQRFIDPARGGARALVGTGIAGTAGLTGYNMLRGSGDPAAAAAAQKPMISEDAKPKYDQTKVDALAAGGSGAGVPQAQVAPPTRAPAPAVAPPTRAPAPAVAPQPAGGASAPQASDAQMQASSSVPVAAPQLEAAGPRTPLTRQMVQSDAGLASSVVAYQRATGKYPRSLEEIEDWYAQRMQQRRPQQSWFLDPNTGEKFVMDPNQGWVKASGDKEAVDTRSALRWLLGAALIGGGLRAGVSLAHRLGTAPTVTLRDAHELYSPEIEMPVEMTPEQLARYRELAGPQAEKISGAWDSTFNALAGVGGGMAGWHLVNALIKRRKQKQLDQELYDLRTQIASLTGTAPSLADPMDPKAVKAAAAWDFLEIAAERYVRHYKNNPANKIAVDSLQKTAGVLDVLKSVGGKVNSLDPLTKVLLGGGAAVAASPMIPGVKETFEGVGKGVTGAATGGAKAVMRPLGYGLAAALGPVAALSLLYGLHRGFSTSKDRDKRIADLKALREAIREQEIAEQPYFKLKPVLKAGEKLPANDIAAKKAA